MKDFAKRYDALGWVVMPLKENDKRPFLSQWSKFKSNDELIDKFRDNNNLGVIMGKTSGVICIDVDVKNPQANGVDTLNHLEEVYGELPQTVTSETPSGGIHYYFKYPQGGIRNRKNVGPGIDIQGDGTYTVEYPSYVSDGKVDGGYEWIIDPFTNDVAELPPSWRKFLAEEKDGIALAAKPFEAPQEIKEGSRNNTIASYVGSLLGKKLKKETVFNKTKRYNKEACNPPLEDEELETIINSMIRTDESNKMNQVRESLNDDEDTKYPWLSFDETGSPQINEKVFAEWYVEKNELYCINDKFYTKYGQKSDAEFKNNIHNIIGSLVFTGLAHKTEALLAAIKNEAYMYLDAPDKYKIQFDNISFDVRTGELVPCEQFFTLHQIAHKYDANADCPTFKQFVKDLFYEEDIHVIQEFLGYCLVPNTLAQTALFIIGEGGEGKSRITVLMEHILGSDNVVIGEFKDLQNKFSTTSLDKQMMFIDDDISLEALDDTSTFKKIVTAETAMEVEPKGKAKYKTKLYSRILCCGNGAIQSKFDRSDGFYRRLLLCKVKSLAYRKPDRLLSDKLDKEIPGIINWLLEGLLRVVKNGFIIKPSARMIKELQLVRDTSDTIQLFMTDDQFVEYTYDEEDKVSIKQLYDAYEKWCNDNNYLVIHKNTFGKTIRKTYKSIITKYLDNVQQINDLVSIERVSIDKKQVRGLAGIKLKNYSGSFTKLSK